MCTQTVVESGKKLCVLAGTALMLVGCQSAGDKPPTRFGSLPFPGVTSLFAAAEPANLAPHYYRSRLARPFEVEGDRGIVFTAKAGFVDISHARETLDWTRYVNLQLEHAPVDGETRTARFVFEKLDVAVTAPAELSEMQRIELAAATTYRLLAWHEISTWFGYSMVPFVSERRSSFTPDDLTAHAIGIRVAREVLRGSPDLATYERLSGERLEQEIAALEPLPADELAEFCSTLHGVWWSGTDSLVVDANMGLASGVKIPLVPDAVTRQPTPAEPLTWSGRDLGLVYSFSVRGGVARDVRAVIDTDVITSDEQLERLASHVAAELRQRRRFAWTDADADGDRSRWARR